MLIRNVQKNPFLFSVIKRSFSRSDVLFQIPVLLGNHVGFAGAFDRLDWESLLLRAIAPARQKNATYIGRYTSAIANKYKRNRCLNSYSSTVSLRIFFAKNIRMHNSRPYISAF